MRSASWVFGQRVRLWRGGSPVARLMAGIAGLPSTGRDLPLTVTFAPADGEEIWTRDFGGHVFRSRQGASWTLLWEKVGPGRMLFEPVAGPDGLTLEIKGLSVFGMPVPRWLLSSVVTREWEEAGRYCFSVEANLPLIGRLIRYSGWLEPTLLATA